MILFRHSLFMFPFPYEGAMSRVVPGIKFGRKKELARFLGILYGGLYGKTISVPI